jgi:hypothetical protein
MHVQPFNGSGEWTVKLTGVLSGSGTGVFEADRGPIYDAWEVEKTNLGISGGGNVELRTKVIEESVSAASA